ncbi:photosynthetic/respiratory NAD(P)H-quinone oxidoreductase subunit L [Thermosynechococcus vestitus]|uniref:NAD(P)H-quinone oxidoreductase subunit L n=1 Tax=Thermosynechococcus vestitus (strain NIES-2133 / IAM M-273 / BP-1) TaxID=197221 RepID=NDHL_THEVB|nr:photosynthetic/respiratory NAD(P)H-quinone oxidoreductase subunit L [Thermosynechococcus vestitus]Q8DKZ3.1 RecName: Full=NAD(P)H-quinone oxidoreductase subunit L; AltName: Full=NAD(P)H dehydrogenase I subunit L; AltName: Full=NDH-1 subunit L; AltName: Full=NDH-L [Thermosynechococcus vestitus BP-1]6HUM_L Chain L, NAD(P)H-quinone oxidoreductase subunit L [Thermosynechococcus vestitus BP-1]6KHI_L Chain L, NAD(P)H-quinone oxidoreductase subunit L [Thermosynechococcus vestitus BP-1]6KHJ_L Chain L
MAVSTELLVLGVYGALAGLYLLVVPAIVYAYLNARWYVASSFERAFMYFLVTFFFPGLLLLAPFINFRPQPRSLNS